MWTMTAFALAACMNHMRGKGEAREIESMCTSTSYVQAVKNDLCRGKRLNFLVSTCFGEEHGFEQRPLRLSSRSL